MHERTRAVPVTGKHTAATLVAIAVAATLLLSFPARLGMEAIQTTRSTASPHPTPLVASAAADGSSADSGAATRVVLYGDSLADESKTYFQDALVAAGITDVATRTFGGTALCDWLDDMREDAGSLHPTSVVIEFSGNAFTSCMRDANDAPLTGDAYYARYFDDAREALAIFAPTDAHVFFVGTPLSRHTAETHDPNAGRLNDLYAWVSLIGHGEYVDAGGAVLDHGEWTSTLPCLPNEPCNGTDPTGKPVNVVRAADGVHFCPTAPDAVNGVTGACPVWSSGAFRFASSMANAVTRHVGLRASGAGDRLWSGPRPPGRRARDVSQHSEPFNDPATRIADALR
jgi:hypothetical protein